jgi:cation:H+ antiporter
MSAIVGLAALAGGIALVIWAADMLVDGLLGVGRALGIAPFVLTVALSGFETENLVAGIAVNAKGLPGAAAGTFLGGITFLAFGAAGLGGVIAPMRVVLPPRFALWIAGAPLPLLVLASDGHLSRVDGAVLVGWWIVSLVGLALSGRALLADESAERIRRPGVRLLAGLATLTGAGWLIGEGLKSTVRHLGISATLLGNTAVAASVEAEEVARIAVPARRGRPELALGTIGGTIVHFAGLNAGVIALVKPLDLGDDTTQFYLPVAAISPAILAGILLVRKRLGRVEGAALIALYVAYIGVAIAISA